MEGMRPIVEMQFADFSSIALNQILNNAGTQYWRTHIPVPDHGAVAVAAAPKAAARFTARAWRRSTAHYPGLVVMTPATVEDAYTMLIDAVAIDDPVIYCEHKYLYYHLKADALPKEALPIGKGASRSAGPRSEHRDLQRDGARSARGREGIQRGRIRNRSGRSAHGEAARYGYRARLRRAHRAAALRRRIISVGRRDRGSDRARRDRRISICSTPRPRG